MAKNTIKTFAAFLLLSITSSFGWAKDAGAYDSRQPLVSQSLTRSSKFDIDTTIETFLGRSLDEAGQCAENKRRQKHGLQTSPSHETLKVVSLKNCAPSLLQRELRNSFGRCPEATRELESIDTSRRTRNATLELGTDCSCTQKLSDYHQKIMLNPLHLFNGPPYSDLSETRGCSLPQLMALISSNPDTTESDLQRAREAFERVKKILSEE